MIRKRNNRRLYDSIMKDVAKTVKKHLTNINEVLNESSKQKHTYDDVLDDDDFLQLVGIVSYELGHNLDSDDIMYWIYDIVCKYISVKDSKLQRGFGQKYWNTSSDEIDDISYHIYDYLCDNK